MRSIRQRISIPSGSAVLFFTTLLSYVLGLLRDRTFAHTFGASRDLDAYNAAFILPDLLFNILIASGIAAAFVPLFTDLTRTNRAAAHAYANTILTAAVSVMLVMAVLFFFSAPFAATLAAPGFTEVEQHKTAQLIRILALSPILFAASNALGAMLVAKRRFLYYGLSPVFYNIGIIGGTVLLAPRFGITGVAWGTVFGAVLHLALRAFDASRAGFHFQPQLDLRTPAFRQTIRLMLPKMIGHPVELATFWAFTALASGLAAGSIAVLNFARNFQSVPVALIGIAVATATFPLLANATSEQSKNEFRRIFRASFWFILFASTAAALTVYLLREPLVALFLGGGAFDQAAVTRTAAVLGMFTLSIPFEALSHLLARAFYATQNTVIPVAATVLSLIVAVPGAWVLAPHFALMALPLGFAAGSFVKIGFLLLLLPRRLRALR